MAVIWKRGRCVCGVCVCGAQPAAAPLPLSGTESTETRRLTSQPLDASLNWKLRTRPQLSLLDLVETITENKKTLAL